MAQGNLTLGAIYPDDMWIDEDVNRMLEEFRKYLPGQVPMVSVRTHVPMASEGTDGPMEDVSVALGKWLAENGNIEAAATRLMRLNPSVFAYYCTTASFVLGVAGDEALKQRVEDATGLALHDCKHRNRQSAPLFGRSPRGDGIAVHGGRQLCAEQLPGGVRY